MFPRIPLLRKNSGKNCINPLTGGCLVLWAFLCLHVSGGKALAQASPPADTVQVTLSDVESRFIQHNLLILAQKYSIEESRAFMLQARLWDNPNIYVEQNTYNQITREYFPARGLNGQNIVQIQQLFQLAGKRNKRVGLERINTEIAEFQLFDLLRTLKYELRSNFYNLYYLQQSLTIYDTEIQSLQRTVELYQFQFERGNVPMKEVIRLKAFLFTLENERKELRNRIVESQSNILLLMGETEQPYLVPLVDRPAVDSLNAADFQLPELTELARNNRYDLKAYEANNRYARQNLAYQKALAVPDVTLGGVYDRNGSYIPNYYGISVGIDLPVFNRNQGNIKAAQARLKSQQLQTENYQLQVEKEVMQAYAKALEADNLYRKFDQTYMNDFDRLMEGMIRSYEKKTISLMEFIDFFESYKDNVLHMNQLQTDRIQAFEELNFTTGKNAVNY
jgi:outer membrane protein, heavy metal efflux system